MGLNGAFLFLVDTQKLQHLSELDPCLKRHDR